ncbi:MAG: glycosyltransferase family 4 protein [Thermoleophilia bacterium]|jgi:glycosyltransferase involved in cell wall biosynthesis
MSLGTRPTIIHAADFAAPYSGNFIASLSALASSCEDRGWELLLALPSTAAKRDWCARLADIGLRVHFLTKTDSVIRAAMELAQLAHASEAVLIHTHFSFYDVPGALASHLLRLRGHRVRVVWHYHSDFPVTLRLKRRVKNLVKYRLLGRDAHIIAVSDHLRTSAIEAGFSSARAHTVCNGIDLARVSHTRRPPSQVREDLRIPAEIPLVLLFGWEPVIKGVDLALEAIERIVASGQQVLLGVVGREALHKFIAQRTANEPIPWLHILKPLEDVGDLYKIASVFLSASRREGFPYSVGEALASKLPAVVSDLPGVAWARNTPGVVFFPVEDSHALEAAIREVLAWDPADRSHRVQLGYSYVKQHLSIESWACTICDLYEELLVLQ